MKSIKYSPGSKPFTRPSHNDISSDRKPLATGVDTANSRTADTVSATDLEGRVVGDKGSDEEETPHMNIQMTLILLVVITVVRFKVTLNYYPSHFDHSSAARGRDGRMAGRLNQRAHS